jgi:hypothetical protein
MKQTNRIIARDGLAESPKGLASPKNSALYHE